MTGGSKENRLAASAPDAARCWYRRIDPALLACALVYLAWYLYLMRADFGPGQPAYWSYWFDQGAYWKSAVAFAHGDLSPGPHWYPLLMSALIAPFTGLQPALAWLPLGFGLYLATWAGFVRVAREFEFSRPLATGLFLVTTLVLPGIGKTWVEPWTTTLSAALIWGALALALDLLGEDAARRTRKRALLLGLVMGLIPCARPTDVLVPALIGLVILFRLGRDRAGLALVGAIVAGGLAVVVPYLLLHLAIYGAETTPYMRLGSEFGFVFGNLGWKAHLILVEPRPWYPDGQGMLRVLPWLVPGIAGGLLAAMTRGRRSLAALLLLPALAYTVLMVAYLDLLPSGLWRFNNIHYFKWLMPLMALYALRFLMDFTRAPGRHAAALAVVVALTCIRYEPVPAKPGEAARLLLLTGEKGPINDVYTARSTITDKAGSLRNFFEYHQIPDGFAAVTHAVALRRDFAGSERVSHAVDPARWPQAAPGFFYTGDITGRIGETPTARYRVRVTLGPPCWLPGIACRTTLAGSD